MDLAVSEALPVMYPARRGETAGTISRRHTGLTDRPPTARDELETVDCPVPLDRQKEALALIRGLIRRSYPCAHKEEAQRFFTQRTGLFRNLNDTARRAPDDTAYPAQMDERAKTLGRTSPRRLGLGPGSVCQQARRPLLVRRSDRALHDEPRAQGHPDARLATHLSTVHGSVSPRPRR